MKKVKVTLTLDEEVLKKLREYCVVNGAKISSTINLILKREL